MIQHSNVCLGFFTPIVQKKLSTPLLNSNVPLPLLPKCWDCRCVPPCLVRYIFLNPVKFSLACIGLAEGNLYQHHMLTQLDDNIRLVRQRWSLASFPSTFLCDDTTFYSFRWLCLYFLLPHQGDFLPHFWSRVIVSCSFLIHVSWGLLFHSSFLFNFVLH